MQRLLSFSKLLSTSPRNLSNSTFLCQSLHLSEPHFSHGPLLRRTHQIFSHRTIVSHSWRSPTNCLSKFNPFLSNPVLVKPLSTNAFLKGPRKRMFDHGIQFFRAQFPRQNFSFNSAFDSRGWQSWIRRRLTSDGVVIGLILTNVAVFMLWRIADRQFMAKNFMIQLDSFKSGRVHTMITSAFSHIEVGHLISNMVGLYFFGMNIGRNFGPEFLLKLYLAGAFVGSAFYLVHHAFMAASSKNKRMWEVDRSQVPGLGASGAVNAIMLLDIFLFPKNTLYLEFIIPVPAILLGIFLIGKDLLRILEGDSQISGSAHLGGAVVAALAWLRIRKGRF